MRTITSHYWPVKVSKSLSGLRSWEWRSHGPWGPPAGSARSLSLACCCSVMVSLVITSSIVHPFEFFGEDPSRLRLSNLCNLICNSLDFAPTRSRHLSVDHLEVARHPGADPARAGRVGRSSVADRRRGRREEWPTVKSAWMLARFLPRDGEIHRPVGNRAYTPRPDSAIISYGKCFSM